MRVLLVGQHKQFATLLKNALDRNGLVTDYQDVRAHINYLDYLVINQERYQVVLFDGVSLDGMELDICAHLRASKIPLPFIIMSPRYKIEDKLSAFEKGTDDYITQPFHFLELIARMNALARRRRHWKSRQVIVGNIVIDLTLQRVYFGGKEIVLTLKEYSLLEYFLYNPNRVVTREQLLDYAWDFQYISYSNVVDVHIKNLRKKLYRDPKKDYFLETIRGMGYRLRV